MNPVLPDMCVPDLIRNVVGNIHPKTHTFLLEKRQNTWQEISYEKVLKYIDAVSAYLISIGIKKGDRVALLLDNSPEYLYFDQGLQQIGAINVSIYPTLPHHEVEYILKDSGARVLLVGTPFLFKKVLRIANSCTELFRIFTLFDDFDRFLGKETLQAGIQYFQDILTAGNESMDTYKTELIGTRESILPSDVSTLIYTSGTTGIPKGTMLTHSNLVNNVRVCLEQIPVITPEDRFLSFLPLSHVFERTATYHVCMACGCQIAFAQSLELLARNMEEVRPSIINCVPRLLERIHDKALKKGTEGGGLKARVFHWAMQTGGKYRNRLEAGKAPGWWLSRQYQLSDRLVFSKIKAKTGGKLKFMISGGGALGRNVGEFFGNLGIRILEGFGLTETSPVVSVTEYHRQVYGTVGRVVPDIEIGIQNYETGVIYTVQTHDSFDPDFESEEGEIIVRGHCIMKGYWNKPALTREVIDADQWFHTGDIGRFYRGNLQITDRLKNMLVNAFGKNIYPTPVENVYLKSPKIEQLFLLGNKRDYVSALIIPNRERLQETFGLGDSYFERPEVFIEDPGILEWINTDVKRLSSELAKFERIRHFKVKRTPFTIESGELTPTLKTKRRVIEDRYAEEIEAMYDNGSVKE